MTEKNMLFLTVPFLALVAGFIFTYFQVWHNKSKRESKENSVTEDILVQLREQEKKDTQYAPEKTKSIKESLDKLTLKSEVRWENQQEALDFLMNELSKVSVTKHDNFKAHSNSLLRANFSYLSGIEIGKQNVSSQVFDRYNPVRPLAGLSTRGCKFNFHRAKDK